MNKVFGITLIVLALAIGILPQFTDCHSQGKTIALPNGKTIDMKCHWTARAEIATAAPLAVVGAVMVASRRKENKWLMAGLGSVLGIAVIAIPNGLIGVCSSAMPCNTVMQPSLTVFGAVAIATSAGSLLLFRKKE